MNKIQIKKNWEIERLRAALIIMISIIRTNLLNSNKETKHD